MDELALDSWEVMVLLDTFDKRVDELLYLLIDGFDTVPCYPIHTMN